MYPVDAVRKLAKFADSWVLPDDVFPVSTTIIVAGDTPRFFFGENASFSGLF
jgi:hypothetical protein